MKKQNLEKILCIPDSHIPYHDKKAFALMLKAAKGFKPHHVVIMGDFIDCYAVSSHSKHPDRALKLKDEVDATKKALDDIKALGAKNNVFVAGNHEDRLERYLKDKAPEVFDYISIPKVLELKERGWKYVPYKQAYQLGKLNITHDTGTAGRYAHYSALDTYQSNVAIGHCHRLGYTVEGNAKGEKHMAATFGWLGDIDAVDYMHRIKVITDWTLGFGYGYLDTKTKNVYMVPTPIVDDTVMVEGVLYSL